jgi:hypothetical protein
LDWERSADRIIVYSFVPPHPFIWCHLHLIMKELGGMQGDMRGTTYIFRPDSRARSWTELSRGERIVFRLPSVGGKRPFDWIIFLGWPN